MREKYLIKKVNVQSDEISYLTFEGTLNESGDPEINVDEVVLIENAVDFGSYENAKETIEAMLSGEQNENHYYSIEKYFTV